MVPLAVGQNIGDVLRVADCDNLCLMVSAEKPDEMIERTADMIRVCRRALAMHACR